jgi:hypothetical protein
VLLQIRLYTCKSYLSSQIIENSKVPSNKWLNVERSMCFRQMKESYHLSIVTPTPSKLPSQPSITQVRFVTFFPVQFPIF